MRAQPQFLSRRRGSVRVLIICSVTALTCIGVGWAGAIGNPPMAHPEARGASDDSSATSTSTPTTTSVPTTAASTTTTTLVPTVPADERKLVQIGQYYSDSITPKSVDASGTGLVFAQNMVYRRTVSVFNARSGSLVKTIAATVDLAHFGLPGGVVQGAPVEGAFSPGAKYFYISNYSMYGSGQGPEGEDTCTPSSALAAGDTPDYVFRIDTATLSIDQVIKVGLVPKFVAVTPNDRYVLVTNWCSWTLSVISVALHKVVATLALPGTPRGIAIDPRSRFAYVAIMGGDVLVRVSLAELKEVGQIYVGSNPRTVVLSPNGEFAYVSLNIPGDVVKVNLRTQRVIAVQHTGVLCRSLVISSDGTALYVVNYGSATVTELRASDLAIVQTVSVPSQPIGITYDPLTHDVWVSSYSGYITRFATRPID
ncbi:MAG TPA: YncE family protein [Acidimicrobiales bacterium]|nr:YncE family protein [Acidimicrobiales bacterium]